jgi:hypothetical protein
VIPFGYAFGVGFMAGEFVGSMLLAANIYFDLGLPLDAIGSAALVGMSVGAPVGWVFGVRWWLRAERQEYYDNYDARLGDARVRSKVEIVHRLPNGSQQIDKPPFTKSQMILAADQLGKLNWNFSLRPFYHIFGQSGATEFRSWMVDKGYAVIGEGGRVDITELGRYTFTEIAGDVLQPSPSRDGSIAIYPSRSQIHTQNTAYEYQL